MRRVFPYSADAPQAPILQDRASKPVGDSMPRPIHRTTLPLVLALSLACGGDSALAPDAGESVLALSLTNLAPLSSGHYEAWIVDQAGTARSAGRFSVPSRATTEVALTSPVSNPREIYVTWEPADDVDPGPSGHAFIGASVSGSTTELTYISYLTPGLPFVEAPGTHVLFTPSDNLETGYPSNEDAGIWLFELGEETVDAGFWLDFMPADVGWIYEGWMVFDYETAGAVWFSYGKFQSDSDKKANTRDDTGLGPFSGQLNYREALPEEIVMPGDDWINNPHGVPVPGDLPLPLDLNGCPSLNCPVELWHGPSRFTHVITMEPDSDVGEDPWLAEPFFVEVYRNAVGEGHPAVKRILEYQGDGLPRGTATLSSKQ